MHRRCVLGAALLAVSCFEEPNGPHGHSGSTGSSGTTSTTGPSTSNSTDPSESGTPTTADDTLVDTGPMSTSSADTTGGGAGCSDNATHRMVLSFPPAEDSYADVPILVRLDATRFDYGLATDDGRDVRFYAMDCEPLPHEIERWQPNGISDIWVGFSTLTGGDAFVLEIGDADAPAPPPSTDIWAAYVGVWHLRENFEDGETIAKDSTEHGLDANDDLSGQVIGHVPDGAIGPAMAFQGRSLRVGTSMLLDVGPSVTIEAWVRTSGPVPSGAFRYALHRGVIVGDVYPYWLALATTDSATPVCGIDPAGVDVPTSVALAQPALNNTWTYVVGTWEAGEDHRITRDGLFEQNGPAVAAAPEDGNALHIGMDLGAQLDEVRLMNGAASHKWVGLQAASMHDMLLDYGLLTAL